MAAVLQPDALAAAAMAALPDGVGVLTVLRADDGAVTDFEWRLANPALHRLFGAVGCRGAGCWKGDGLVGRRLRADGGCSGVTACVARCLADCLVDGVAGGPPLQRVMTAGTTRWRVAASPFADGVCVTVVDLGPAQPSGHPLEEALEHCAEGFALFDAADRLVQANRRLCELLPELADHLVPGTGFDALARRKAAADPILATEGERAAWVRNAVARHRAPPAAAASFAMPTAAGHWLLVSERATPDGGVLTILTDITDLKRQEEALRTREAEAEAARQAAERANRIKSEFLAHMSHELRTPLNAVLGFAELLLDETFGPLGSPRYHAYARDIHESGAHLLALINDILDLSRIEAGRMVLNEEAVDVADAARQAMAMVAETANKRGVRLDRDLADDLPLLLGDARGLRQMLINLLSNAVKFTPADGQVVLSGMRTPDGGVGVMIADTGIGIAPEDMERVLEPFGRADISIVRGAEGTGLGLPIVKRMVELHGGRLELWSEPGAGTTAILIFPPERSIARSTCTPFPPAPGEDRRPR